MVSSFHRTASGRRRFGFTSSSVSIPLPRKSWVSRFLNLLVVICSAISFFSVVVFAYLFVLPNLSLRLETSHPINSTGRCDVFTGSWIADNSYPLYNSSECPFAERGFNCLANGRRDRDYLRWQWKPKHCDFPPFDVRRILEELRGKRIVFVGDSMSRTHWESAICLLMTGVQDKKSVYEVNGNKITKQIRFLSVRFSTFNFTVEFFRSVFLVRLGKPPRHSPRRVQSAIELDVIDGIHQRWNDSDVLVFNSGQWWNPGKLFSAGCYFQVNGTLKLGMPINKAFRTAMSTWASWVETMVNTSKTNVFFRTFEPSHWSPDRNHCKVTQYPLHETNGSHYNAFSDIISEVVGNMKVPVTVLNVTYMGALRSDAHVGKWSDTPTVLDCSHWCLPGVPDAWNELFFSLIHTKL